jgi:hypothetical protein
MADEKSADGANSGWWGDLWSAGLFGIAAFAVCLVGAYALTIYWCLKHKGVLPGAIGPAR